MCIRDSGITIFISSHVLSEIEQIADIIGVMHEGHLVCLLYTSFHDLTDREPLAYSITVKTGYNPTRLKDECVQVFTIKAVSYTHLDVYKRQLPVRENPHQQGTPGAAAA